MNEVIESGRPGGRTTGAERVVPQAVDAEKGALSVCMQDPAGTGTQGKGGFPLAQLELDESCFFVPAHQVLWRELSAHVERLGGVFDMIAFAQSLRDVDVLGGEAYLAEVFAFAPSVRHGEHYFSILRKKRRRRKVIEVAELLLEGAYDEEREIEDVLGEAEELLLAAHGTEVAGPVRLGELVHEVVEDAGKAYEFRGTTEARIAALGHLSTGLKEVDRMLTGLKAGQLVVIAGRPSMGKTALATNLAEHFSLDGDVEMPGYVFSLEMTARELADRILAGRAGVPPQKLSSGFFTKTDLPNLQKIGAEVYRKPLYLDDAPKLTITDLKSRARLAKMRWGIRFFVVDYLQLVAGVSRKAEFSREREVAEVAEGLKALAKELNVPVIATAQLGRKAEERPNKRPTLGDLRESGQIEQAADVVGLLFREYYYLTNKQLEALEEKDPERLEELRTGAELIIAKQRGGATGAVKLHWDAELTRFGNREGTKDYR